MFKKTLSKLIVASLLFTMIVPNFALAAGGNSLTDDFAAKSSTQILKKNKYEQDLLDVCYYPNNSSFYAAGNNGLMLESIDGNTWNPVADSVLTSSTNVNFVDMYCTSNQIAVVGQETGKNFIFLKNNDDDFTKQELIGTGNHIVQAVAISGVNIAVTTNTSSYYHSTNSGDTWNFDVLNASSTGATAIAVDPTSGKFKVYNNSSQSTFDSLVGLGEWLGGATSNNQITNVKNIYRNSDEWLVLMNNGTSSAEFSHSDLSQPATRNADYMLEAAYSAGSIATQATNIFVGWKSDPAGDRMIIRSNKDPNFYVNDPNNNKLYTYAESYHPHSWVGNGRLYGIAAGSISGGTVYIAVGSNGSILKSTDGYQFAPVAPQEIDTAAQVKHLIASDDPVGTTTPGQQVIITTDNRVYYSNDRGVTWNYVHKLSLAGEVASARYVNFGINTLRLFIATNDSVSGHATSYQMMLPIVESSSPLNDFTIRGAAPNAYGIVYYGTTSSNGKAKIVSHSSNSSFVYSSSDVEGDIQLTLDYGTNQTSKFAFIGSNAHVVTLPNNTSPYTIPNGGGIGKMYVAWAEGNARQIMMDATGYVRVFNNPNQSGMSYRDELIFVGQGIPLSASFELNKLVFVNGLYAALGKDGNVYTTFDGIVWTHQADLSSVNDIVDIAKYNNSLLLLNKNNAIEKVTVSYNAWDDKTFVQFPDPTITAPQGAGPYDGTQVGVNVISVDTSSDPHAVGNTVSYKWFTGDLNGPTDVLTGQTANTLDLSELSAGINRVYVEVTYSNPDKVDQPESKRMYGPFGYDIFIPSYEVEVDYSATSFTVEEGYDAVDVTPITVTIENTGNQAITDLQISSSNTSVATVGALSSTNLAVGGTATAQIKLVAGLTQDLASTTIAVSSATGNISEAQTISVNVVRYELSGQVDRDVIQLAHDYASANDAKVTLTLNNTGNRDLEDVTVTLSDTDNFQLSSNPTEIEMSAMETIDITPKVALLPGQTYVYMLTIESDAPTITQTVTIKVDEMPRFEVTLTPVKNNVTISDDYTDVTSGELVVSIENTGNRDLTDLAVALQGADAGSFTLNTISPNLSVGQSVSVIATPNANLPINAYNATLTVTGATYSINKSEALTLTVTDVPVYNVNLSLGTDTLTLAHGYTTNDGTITATLQNTGNRAVTPTVSVSDTAVLAVGTVPATIGANTSGSFELNVQENVSAGTYVITLTVTSDAGTLTETITVHIEAAPLYQLSVTADRLSASLAHQYTDASAGKFVLTALNNGNQDLNNVAVSATDTTNFTVGTISTQLAVGDDAFVEVTPIAGLASGTYPVTVTFSADQITDQEVTLNVVVASAPAPDPDPTPDSTPEPTPNPTPNPAPNPTPNPESSSNGSVEVIPTTSTTSTNANGDLVVTQQVDEQRITDLLASATSGTTMRITQETNADIVKTELSGSLMQALGNKQATVEVQTNSGTYKLPTAQLDLNGLAQQFGTGVTAADLQVTVNIAKSDAQTVQVVADAAQNGKVTLVVTPVEFSVTVSYNGQTHEVTQYSEYVAREIPIPADVDPQSITTAVVLDKDGSLRAVPTTVVLRDGNYYAVIKSLTNSIYTLIHNEVKFDDVVGHWSDASVHDLANRLIVHGANEHTFGPDKSITRAEFAAIVVRALGLPQDGSHAAYKDVQASDWFAGAVAKASEYGLISGYENAAFRPQATITREEAFAIIARAMKLAGLAINVTGNQTSEILVVFEDGSSVSRWAAPSVATVVRSGIVQGSNAKLRPTGNITRAETAAIVQRLLIQAGLIDN